MKEECFTLVHLREMDQIRCKHRSTVDLGTWSTNGSLTSHQEEAPSCRYLTQTTFKSAERLTLNIVTGRILLNCLSRFVSS